MRKNCLILFLPILLETIGLPSLKAQQPEGLLQSAVYEEDINGDLDAAINLYIQIVNDFSTNRPAAAEALLRLGLAYEKQGLIRAGEYYRRLINEYSDQTIFVARAKSRLQYFADRERGSSSNELKPLTVTLMDFEPGAHSSLSPDGKYISYRDSEGWQLTIYDIASGESQLLTDSKNGNCVLPIWSRDSKKIAYQWVYHDMAQGFRKAAAREIRIYDLESGADQWLCSATTEYGNLTPMHWTHDGLSIMGFIRVRNGLDRLIKISLENGSIELIKEFQGWCGPPCQLSISPDDQVLLYDTLSSDRKAGIRVFSHNKSLDRPMQIDRANNNWIASWLPDGKGFLYYSDLVNKSGALWKATVNEKMEITETKMILDGIGDMSGNFGMTNDGIFYYRQHVRRNDLYTVEFDPDQGTLGSPQFVDLGDLSNPVLTSWLPGGSQLGYLKSEMGQTWIEIKDILSGEISKLDLSSIADRSDGAGMVKWSLDGSNLLLKLRMGSSNNIFNFELLLIDSNTGQLKTITKNVRFEPHFDTNNNILYANDSNQIIEYNLNTEDHRILYASERSLILFDLSPDGKQLAFFEGSKENVTQIKDLISLDLENNIRTVLWTSSESDPFSRASGLKWLGDGRRIMIGLENQQLTTQQWFIYHVSSRSMIKLGEPISGPENSIRGIDVHPTKNIFSFNRLYRKINVWKVENF